LPYVFKEQIVTIFCMELGMDEEKFFCKRCGKQLNTIDEIEQGFCSTCTVFRDETQNEESFFCWTCGKTLHSMHEKAQGVCDNCKASIIRKLSPLPRHK
jgi:DNA-directed RNA polymerase subunit RPC12/RpoP